MNVMKFNLEFDLIVGFLYFSISNMSRMFFEFGGIPRELTYGTYLLFLALFFVKYFPKVKYIDILYYLLAIPIVLYGLINYGEYIESNSRIYATLLLFLPSYLFFRLYDQTKITKVFIYSQYYAVIYLLFYYGVTVRFMDRYSMDYAYWIVVPICTMAYLYLQQHVFLYLLLTVVSTITLILSGCRGALILGFLCIFYFYVSKEFLERKSIKWFVKIFGIFFLILLILLTSNFWLSILSSYSNQSRTIQKIVQGAFFESATRERLYWTVTSLIENNPSGYGPMASRMVLTEASYPHSLFYECQLDYGVLIGTFISLAILIIGIFNLIRYRKSEMRLIAGYVTIIGLGSLMVSSSYYYEFYVPATFALFYNYNLSSREFNEMRDCS